MSINPDNIPLVKIQQSQEQQQVHPSYTFSILQKTQEAKKRAKFLQRRKTIVKQKMEKKLKEGYSFGRWNPDQQKQYVRFLQTSTNNLDLFTKNRIKKFFTAMSQLIPTRTINQCRSHHQKCLLKYETAENIVKKLRSRLSQNTNQENQNSQLNLQEISPESDQQIVNKHKQANSVQKEQNIKEIKKQQNQQTVKRQQQQISTSFMVINKQGIKINLNDKRIQQW